MFEDFRLRVFTQVASLGSFTAAAKALGVSQPAVSQHIAELEKSAGGKLFERERGSVSLTARGRLLLEHAERILSEYKRLDGAFHVPDSILLKDVLYAGQRRNILSALRIDAVSKARRPLPELRQENIIKRTTDLSRGPYFF